MFGEVIVEGTVGLEETESGLNFVMFPNPVNERLKWKWDENKKPASAVLSIFNVRGTLVDQFNLVIQNNVDISTYSVGFYTYLVETEEGKTQTGKFLVNR